MSSPSSNVPSRPVGARELVAVGFFTFFTVLLIWTEIWVAVAAAEWSIGTVLGFGKAGFAVVSLLVVPPAIWASWQTLRLAWRAEMEHRNV